MKKALFSAAFVLGSVVALSTSAQNLNSKSTVPSVTVTVGERTTTGTADLMGERTTTGTADLMGERTTTGTADLMGERTTTGTADLR
ncbi:MAG: hypothetical protein JWP44_3549 [Mucilaginibacter sp.]|nr:hypothetical protein [Mucilaginibacter sp.]